MRGCWIALIWLLAYGVGFIPAAARAIGLQEPKAAKSSKTDKINFDKGVKPLLSRYCYGCHGEKKKGDLDFRIYTDESTTLRGRQVFEKVLAKLQAHEMPPENKPQPTAAECQLITNWVASCCFKCDCDHPDSGRRTI